MIKFRAAIQLVYMNLITDAFQVIVLWKNYFTEDRDRDREREKRKDGMHCAFISMNTFSGS